MLYIWKHLNGTIAQLVEQRTENPCVPGSIPGGTTDIKLSITESFIFLKPLIFCNFTN